MQPKGLPKRFIYLLSCLFLATAMYCLSKLFKKDGIFDNLFLKPHIINQNFAVGHGKHRDIEAQALTPVMETSNNVRKKPSGIDDMLLIDDDQITPGPTFYTNNICYVSSSDTMGIEPLSNFINYPCLKGVPAFTELKSENVQTVKCVRTYCFPTIKNAETWMQSTNSCVPLKTLLGKTPICIYPVKNDVYISKSLKISGQWENERVSALAKFIKAKPGTEFLDIGCNIGAYTLSIAHLGIKVTAMDPLLENLELLSRSLVLGQLQDNVTLIWNAALNAHTLIKFRGGHGNVGATRIDNVNSTKAKNVRRYTASAIMLDDLVPLFKGKRVAIKMDIEESEYKALLGARRFLNETDIEAIQMEFLKEIRAENGARIIEYMTSKGFLPFKDLGKRSALESKTMMSWPPDVYFMKKV